MSKSKGTLLFAAKADTSKMTLKDRIVHASKTKGQIKSTIEDGEDGSLHDATENDSLSGSPIFKKHHKVLTEEQEWEQFVQEADRRKLDRVSTGSAIKDVSEYEDEIAYVRRMVLTSRFATKHLIPDSVNVAFKNMQNQRELQAITESIGGESEKQFTLKNVIDHVENSLMEDHVRDQFLQEQKEFLEEKKLKWTERKAKEKATIYAAAEKGFTADGLITVAKMLEIQQEIAAQRAQFEMRGGKSEDQWIIHQFKMDAINGFKQALQDTPEGDLARADLENSMGPSHITLIRNLDKHRKLVASSKQEKYRKKAAFAVQMDEYTGKHENAMHGSSVLKSLSMRFDGSFHTNSFVGPGMLIHNNGLRIIGDFCGDCVNGLGVLVHAKEGWWYKGELLGSRRHGFGVWAWINHGIMYEGLWDQDRIHGFGCMKSLSSGCYLAGRWNFGILDEYGRLLDDLGNLHSIKCPARRSGKNIFKPELASFIQGGKICDDNPDDHNNCVRFAETAKSLIALSMFKVKNAEETALVALKNVQDKEQLEHMLKFAGINYIVADPEISKKFGMSGQIYSANKVRTDQHENSNEIIEEPVSLVAKEFSCSSHFCIGDHIDCICVVKAMEVRRLIALFASVYGEEVTTIIDSALSDAKPLLKFDCESLTYIVYCEEHRALDVEENDETFERSFFLCGPVFHKACHALRHFYGLRMWKWYKRMKWFRVFRKAKSLNRSMQSIYGDGEFTHRSESSFFSRWMIPDDSRPHTARSLLEDPKSNAEIGRIRQSLAVYIDPVYYEKPPELDELRDINIRATAAYEGYSVEIFEDEMQLICRVPSKRAIFNNTIVPSALKNTPKTYQSSHSSAPSSRPSSKPSIKTRGKKSIQSLRGDGLYNSLYHDQETDNQERQSASLSAGIVGVVHSRPGSAVRFAQSHFDSSEALLSTLVADSSFADPKSITNFASKENARPSDYEESEWETGIHDDDHPDKSYEGDNPLNDFAADAESIDSDRQLRMEEERETQEYSDTSKAVKMSLRDGFTHYGLHLQWDLREIPSFETHRNVDIFEVSENVSVAGSECSSLYSSYVKLLFS